MTVLGDNEIDLPEYLYRPKRDVLQVPYRCGDDVEKTRHGSQPSRTNYNSASGRVRARVGKGKVACDSFLIIGRISLTGPPPNGKRLDNYGLFYDNKSGMLKFLFFLALMTLAPLPGMAAIYGYVDAGGVYHLTNIRPAGKGYHILIEEQGGGGSARPSVAALRQEYVRPSYQDGIPRRTVSIIVW